ncbi:uncharacterized protein PAC_08199 [Phialocephala subalpina]|uniref:DUF6590 domain-containing protein n=1 Tax=Phialocephala subalpina TaxID=576137 RepID=A0A1L7WZX7_9HELO|nr:uncharacterized protein PAC_08199 [Phialocephala subalpina]
MATRNRRRHSDQAGEYNWSDWSWEENHAKYWRYRFNSKGEKVWDSHASSATSDAAPQGEYDPSGSTDITSFASSSSSSQNQYYNNDDYHQYNDQTQLDDTIDILEEEFAKTTLTDLDSAIDPSNYYRKDDRNARDTFGDEEDVPYLGQSYDSAATVAQATHSSSRRRSDLLAPTPPAPLRLPSDLSISPQDVHKEITGAKGKHEKLDRGFRVHHSKSFQPGHIFKVIWAEPAGETSKWKTSSITDVTSEGWTVQKSEYGARVYSSVRRFVIVDTKKGYSNCVPILTYQRRGFLKSGAHPEDHAVIYTSDKPPNEAVTPTLTPIHVQSKTPRDKLQPLSFVNYAKIYTVEHNVKVMFIGWIANESQRSFAKDFDYVWKGHRQMSRGDVADTREEQSRGLWKQKLPVHSAKPVFRHTQNPAGTGTTLQHQAVYPNRMASRQFDNTASDEANSMRNAILSADPIPPAISKSPLIEPESPFNIKSNFETTETSQGFQVDLRSEIKSTIADRDDLNSLSLTRRTQQQTTAEEHLGILFAEREELVPACEEVLTKLGRDKFVETFQKLLKRFYLDILPHATTDAQMALLHLFRSRWARIRIAEHVVDILRPQTEDMTAQNGISLIYDKASEFSVRFEQEVSAGQKLRDLQNWIPAEADCNAVAPPEISDFDDTMMHRNIGREDEYDHDNDDEDDDEGDNETPIKGLPKISEMECFLTKGEAFQNFHTHLRLSLLPASLASLTRIIMSIPNDRIWFSREDDHYFWNKAKLYIEESTGYNWNWWPLQQPMRRLEEAETRIHWHCHCGKLLWAELPSSQVKNYQALLEHRCKQLQHRHLCKLKGLKSTGKLGLASFVQAASNIALETYHSYTSSGNGSSTASVGAEQSSSSSPRQSGSQTTTSPGSSQPSSLPSQQGVQMDPSDATNIQLFILFGVKGTRRTTELAQLDTKKYCDDNVFFRDLRQRYKDMRGFWRYWFSFERVRADRFVLRGKSLPETMDYEYKPRPPNAENPPISRHEFELAFAVCPNRCRLANIHDCVEPADGTFAIERIPKRRGPLEIRESSIERAWGIQAQNDISAIGVVTYHFLAIAATIGFMGWWIHGHAGDLQTATVPLSIAISLIALFWSTVGVLKLLREPV